MGGDLRAVTDAIRGSLAPKTWSSYSAAWSSWLFFASTEGFNFNRPSEGTSDFGFLVHVNAVALFKRWLAFHFSFGYWVYKLVLLISL